MSASDIRGNIAVLKAAIEEADGRPVGQKAVIFDAAFILLEGLLVDIRAIAERELGR